MILAESICAKLMDADNHGYVSVEYGIFDSRIDLTDEEQEYLESLHHETCYECGESLSGEAVNAHYLDRHPVPPKPSKSCWCGLVKFEIPEGGDAADIEFRRSSLYGYHATDIACRP